MDATDNSLRVPEHKRRTIYKAFGRDVLEYVFPKKKRKRLQNTPAHLMIVTNVIENLYQIAKDKIEDSEEEKIFGSSDLDGEEKRDFFRINNFLNIGSALRVAERFGFDGVNPGSKGAIAKRAKALAEALLANPSDSNIEDAMQFVDTVEIVNSLKKIAKDKKGMKNNLKIAGLEDEKDLGVAAYKLAKSIMKNPGNKKNIKTALKLIKEVERIEFRNLRNLSPELSKVVQTMIGDDDKSFMPSLFQDNKAMAPIATA